MRRLYPSPADDVDPAAEYGADTRVRPDGDRPWVTVNMIASVDGATVVEGKSGGLGSPADRAVFAALRSTADVIMVGAGTVRAESYAMPKAAGLLVVTASAELDPASRLFATSTPDHRPVVVTTASAETSHLADVADIRIAGDTTVDVRAAIEIAGSLGARVLLCEGGPTLNGHVLASGCLDELCLSVSPLVAAGKAARIVVGQVDAPVSVDLDRVLEEDGMLFCRYLTT